MRDHGSNLIVLQSNIPLFLNGTFYKTYILKSLVRNVFLPRRWNPFTVYKLVNRTPLLFVIWVPSQCSQCSPMTPGAYIGVHLLASSSLSNSACLHACAHNAWGERGHGTTCGNGDMQCPIRWAFHSNCANQWWHSCRWADEWAESRLLFRMLVCACMLHHQSFGHQLRLAVWCTAALGLL